MAFYALSNVEHDGQNYSRGDEVTGLTPEQAQPLVELGVVSEDHPETGGDVVTGPLAPTRHETAEWRDNLPPSEIPHPVEAEATRIAAEQAAQGQAPVQPAEVPSTEPSQPLEQQEPAQPEQPAEQPASDNEVPAAQPVQVKVEKLK